MRRQQSTRQDKTNPEWPLTQAHHWHAPGPLHLFPKFPVYNLGPLASTKWRWNIIGPRVLFCIFEYLRLRQKTCFGDASMEDLGKNISSLSRSRFMGDPNIFHETEVFLWKSRSCCLHRSIGSEQVWHYNNKMDMDILTGLCLSMEAWWVSASEQRAKCAHIDVYVYGYMFIYIMLCACNRRCSAWANVLLRCTQMQISLSLIIGHPLSCKCNTWTHKQ